VNSPLREGEFRIIRDGWIKIERSDYTVGLRNIRRSRMLIGLNQLLFRLHGKNILIDAGLGTKWSREELGLLDFELPRGMLHELQTAGLEASSIDIIVYSHLHYDHSGGGTRKTGAGKVAPTFPNALYYAQSKEIEAARESFRNQGGDYREEDISALESSGQLHLIDGDAAILPGLNLFLTRGHSPGHQVAVVELSGRTLFYAGDLISTSAHANLRVTMTYDLDRNAILAQRRKWLERIREGGWTVFYCHGASNILSFV